MNRNFRSVVFPRRHAYRFRRAHSPRPQFIQLVSVVHRAAHFRRFRPIHRSQILHHPQRIPRSRQHARLRNVGRRHFSPRHRHPLHGIHFLPFFVQMHLVLQARHRPRVAVGIKLVVEHEHHAQRILGMRKRLQVPGILPQKVFSLSDLQPDGRNVIHRRHARRIFQHFPCSHRQPRIHQRFLRIFAAHRRILPNSRPRRIPRPCHRRGICRSASLDRWTRDHRTRRFRRKHRAALVLRTYPQVSRRRATA